MPRSSSSNSDAVAAPRLQKVLATAGYGSRRQCETLIQEGRVEIDREIVMELGTRVDLNRQEVRVDGVALKLPRHKYFALNKPVGVVSTARDPWARTRVIDLVDDPDRLFNVGRLDKSSSGLILVTNDGDVAHRLTHPRFGVEKTYRVVVAGKPTVETLQQLKKGIYLAEGKARVERIVIKRAHKSHSSLEMVLTEGKNREIRRLLARVGHKVQQLTRIAIGPIRLGELPVGAHRELTPREVGELRRLVSGDRPAPKRAASKSRPGRKSKSGRDGVSKSASGMQQKKTGKRVERQSQRGAKLSGTKTIGTVLGADDDHAMTLDKPRRAQKSGSKQRTSKKTTQEGRSGQTPRGKTTAKASGQGRGKKESAGRSARTQSAKRPATGRAKRKPK